MRTTTAQQLAELQNNPENIRNICILAHVDHGKTTLADSLVASNGIISQRMAGKLRYLDSRKDEQKRGITMKSSAISLHYLYEDKNCLINLIDSPGHVDFSGEVSTAVRLCDGAIVVVDVVEGICPQTKVALRQAWTQHIRPLLVLNKIDRLILELRLTPLDAHVLLQQVLEQVNAFMAELFTADVLEKSSKAKPAAGVSQTEDQVFDWSSGLEESDDSSLYFSPDQGNVVFASALDGWGFRIDHFAKLYSEKLGISGAILQRTLWGDFYWNSKLKRITKGAQAKAKKPLFVQCVLENIWSAYEAIYIRRDKEMTGKIVSSLSLKIATRDASHADPRVQLRAVCGQWLPLAEAVLKMVCQHAPSPTQLSEERVKSLMCTGMERFASLPLQTQQLKQSFLSCSSSADVPVIVCISKMIAVEKKFLPENKPRCLTPEELAQRKEEARRQHAKRLAGDPSSTVDLAENLNQGRGDTASAEESSQAIPDEPETFVAFARIFSGRIRRGIKLYVLGPKHNPGELGEESMTINPEWTLKDLRANQHVTIATIEQLYLLMGRELEVLEEVPAGNILGIGGLEDHVLKSATLSSTLLCPPFVDLFMPSVPVLRVALEPALSGDMPALVHGMKLLNQADPCVQVLVQETGEHVIVTAGEVHLQRCLDDLQERFAKVKINVSSPIVPFRETIISPPKVDMVNEVIEEKNQILRIAKSVNQDELKGSAGTVEITTPNKKATIVIRTTPLPREVTELLEESASILKAQNRAMRTLQNDCGEKTVPLSEETLKGLRNLRENLKRAFSEAGREWTDAVDKIWSFGPRHCGPNLLVNNICEYRRPSAWIDLCGTRSTDSPLFEYDSSFVSGFQLACLAGPLCEEPMMGVCFIVERWDICKENTSRIAEEDEHVEEACNSSIGERASSCSPSQSALPYGPFAGQIMSSVKEACRRAFQAQPQRLMAAMYSCTIQVTADALGRMYAVLGRRHGRVLSGDMQEGSQTFQVTAVLPVIESFDFANEIRKQTSGLASPQLVFSHWEVVDVDPFWVPSTEEEYLHFGDKADTENRARKYVNSVRRRKGLPVDEKIVEHAEKQRTLTKKK